MTGFKLLLKSTLTKALKAVQEVIDPFRATNRSNRHVYSMP